MNFPVATRELGDWLPHREPALWIDEVRAVGADGGECRVYVRQHANYADGRGRIRDSSFVEWMAQAYGFVGACQVLTGLVQNAKKPEKTFLVQVRDLELTDDAAANLIFEGDWLTIRVKRTHQLGPIALVEGLVLSSKDVQLARAKLKLFAE